MIRRFLLVAAVCVLAVSASAQPNFSGSWKLNKARSDFGQLPPPQRFDRVIRHNEPSIEVDTTQSSPGGDISSSVRHVIDGKETLNVVNGREIRSTLSWDGDTLVIRSQARIQGTEIRTLERWTLAPDGGTLTTVSLIQLPQGGEARIRLVLDKAAGPNSRAR